MGQVFTSWSDLAAQLTLARKDRKVVFTNGCFDILHVGHVRYLQEAKSLGDFLVVGLNTDASVRRLKGSSRPIQSEGPRAEIMAALGCVDFVTLFDEETPEKLIRQIRPDVLVKGGDYELDQIAGASFVRSYGGVVKSLRFVEGFSTSSILNRVR